MNWVEPLTLPFMQRAGIAGVLLALLAGYYGPFVVQRRMAFLGAGLAHAAFGGVAVGLFARATLDLDLAPLWFAAPLTILTAFLVVWLREHAQLAEDTIMGGLFAVAMAGGAVLLAMTPGYAGDPMAYLFGSLLAVGVGDLAVVGGAVVVSALTLPLWPAWAYATFDRDLARSDGVRVGLHDYLLAAAIAMTIVVALNVVGILLAAAFLVMPAATARLRANTLSRMTIGAIAYGVASVLAGLFAAYHLDLPSGPAIVLMQAAVFSVVLSVSRR